MKLVGDTEERIAEKKKDSQKFNIERIIEWMREMESEGWEGG